MSTRTVISVAMLAVLVLVLGFAGTAGARSMELGDGAVFGDASSSRDIQETIWFQGFVADLATGEPINATYTVTARMYDVELGGTPVWGPEPHDFTEISEGWFNIELGVVIGGFPPFDTPPYYLQLWIGGEMLEPRLKLASVPSALASNWNGGTVTSGITAPFFRSGNSFHIREGDLFNSMMLHQGGLKFKDTLDGETTFSLLGSTMKLYNSVEEQRVLIEGGWDCGRLELYGPYPIILDACSPGVLAKGGFGRPVAGRDGDLSASTIYYGLAGPEVGTYVRGTAKLVDGRADVVLPAHFQTATSPDGVTVQVTPLSADSKGLSVVSWDNGGFSVIELHSGIGNYGFSYLVQGVQSGRESVSAAFVE